VLVPMAYTATVMPFSLFFLDSGSDEGWVAVEAAVSLCFLLDMLLNFNLAYYSAKGGLVVRRYRVGGSRLLGWPTGCTAWRA
jgi:hypothetical protein